MDDPAFLAVVFGFLSGLHRGKFLGLGGARVLSASR